MVDVISRLAEELGKQVAVRTEESMRRGCSRCGISIIKDDKVINGAEVTGNNTRIKVDHILGEGMFFRAEIPSPLCESCRTYYLEPGGIGED